MSEQTCANCKYFNNEEILIGKIAYDGSCRIRSEGLCVVDLGDSARLVRFPPRDAGDWCGEFSDKQADARAGAPSPGPSDA